MTFRQDKRFAELFANFRARVDAIVQGEKDGGFFIKVNPLYGRTYESAHKYHPQTITLDKSEYKVVEHKQRRNKPDG